jgi:biopolymer transport protein ExbD
MLLPLLPGNNKRKMAEIQQQQTHSRSRRRSHASIRVDMTPLVDLAFLLLTFFVLTTELSKQNAIATTFPKNSKPETLVNNGLTVLLGKNPENIYWYRGEFSPSLHLHVVKGNAALLNVLKNANEFVFDRVEIIDRQHNLGLLNDVNWNKKRAELLGDKTAPFVILKWNKDASYGSVVTVLDDLIRIHDTKYAVVAVSDEEQKLMK